MALFHNFVEINTRRCRLKNQTRIQTIGFFKERGFFKSLQTFAFNVTNPTPKLRLYANGLSYITWDKPGHASFSQNSAL